MKIERGVMVVKDGLAWGVTHEDGHSTCYGWVDPADAKIYDPLFFNKPTDATMGFHTFDELESISEKEINPQSAETQKKIDDVQKQLEGAK